MNHLLSWIIWLPVIGIIAVIIIPRDKGTLIKQVSAVVTGVQLVLTIYLWRIFDGSNGTFQFMESAEWIPSFNISYMLGVDGLSLPMVFLTALLGFLGVFISWNINKAVKFPFIKYGYYGCFPIFGFLSVLCFLGSNVVAHVLSDRHVGRASTRICCH